MRPILFHLTYLLPLLCLLGGVARADTAARADFAVGEVQVQGSDGALRLLQRGGEVGGGDLVRTGVGARVQLRFTDGAMVSLSPGSEFRVDDYHFTAPAEAGEKGFFSLLKGGLRTISGWIGKGRREAYRMNTVVATIGIRGTDYSVAYGAAGDVTVATHAGQVEVCNAGGCVLVGAGESARVPDAQTRPALTGSGGALGGMPSVGGGGEFSAAGERRDGSGAPAGLGGNGPGQTPGGGGTNGAAGQNGGAFNSPGTTAPGYPGTFGGPRVY